MRACSRPPRYQGAGLKAKIAKSIPLGLKRLRKKALVALQDQQGLKPDVDSAAFAARVNSCPDTNHLNNRVFPQAVMPGET
jgi:hypothetical protein